MIKLPDKSIKLFKQNLDEIFSSGYLAEGPWNDNLSEKIKTITGSRYAIPTVSNGAGIVTLLQIYKEYFGRCKVMIQSNTMYGVKTMVKSGGHSLVGYIDCQLETLMPSINDVIMAVEKYEGNYEELIILLSDIGGIINPDEEEISSFCKERNLVLLEDCAHSFGATFKGKYAGTFGNAGVYSFYATKAIFAGEGGVIITNDAEIGELASRYIKYDRFDQKMTIGINLRPSEIQALLIHAVVTEFDHIISNKSKTAKKYAETCDSLEIPYIDQESGDLKGNYYKFVLISPNKKISEFLRKLRTTTSAVYDYALGRSKMITSRHVCLPVWYGLEEGVSNAVVNELQNSIS